MSQETVEQLKERARYYYIRRGEHPVGCVAAVKLPDGSVARGVSVCSPEDNFERKEARKKAYKRLCRAVGAQCSSDPIKADLRDPEHPVLNVLGSGLSNKSAFKEPATNFEARLLKDEPPVGE
jgi:hypothetical protein